MSKLKFAKFRTSANYDNCYDIVHNLFFQNFNGTIQQEIVGVVMFAFETVPIGKFVVLFDVFQKDCDLNQTSGIYPVQEKFVEYVECELPAYVTARLLSAISHIVPIRTKLASAGARFLTEQDAVSFIYTALGECKKSVLRDSSRLPTTNQRNEYMRKSKVVIDQFEKKISQSVKLLKENVEKERFFEEKIQTQKEVLLSMRQSMYKLRLKRNHTMHWRFIVDSKLVVEQVDKELLFLYGNYDVAKVIDPKKVLTFFSASINTRKQIDRLIHFFYTEQLNCTVADVLTFVPFLDKMNCTRLLTTCFSYVERNMRARELPALIRLSRFLKNFNKATVEILVQILSRRILAEQKDIRQKLLRISQHENAPQILRLKR